MANANEILNKKKQFVQKPGALTPVTLSSLGFKTLQEASSAGGFSPVKSPTAPVPSPTLQPPAQAPTPTVTPQPTQSRPPLTAFQQQILSSLKPTAVETQAATGAAKAQTKLATLQAQTEVSVGREEQLQRGRLAPIIRGRQAGIRRQAGLEALPLQAQIAGLQRQQQLQQQQRVSQQQVALTQLGFAEQRAAREAGVAAEQRAEQRQISGEERAVSRQAQQFEQASAQRQQQFEQNLALKGFNKISSPDQLAGLTEDQVQRVPNPITGNIDIFKKPVDDDLLSVSEAKELGLAFGTTISEAAKLGIIPTKTVKGATDKGFLPLNIIASGEKVPTFEEFISTKENELQRSMPQEEREGFRLEYNTLAGEIERNSGKALNFRLQDRVKNLPKNQRENAVNQVASFINSGLVDEANKFIDGLGSPLGDTQSRSLIQARLAKKNVLRIKQLLDDIGAQGPLVGRFRQSNPFDDRVVEITSLIKQTTPGLARGVFGEVGVLTDADIENYVKTLANPNLLKSQVDDIHNQLMQTINSSIQIQLDTLDRTGKDVSNFRDILEEVGVEIEQFEQKDNIIERGGAQFRQNPDGSVTRIK